MPPGLVPHGRVFSTLALPSAPQQAREETAETHPHCSEEAFGKAPSSLRGELLAGTHGCCRPAALPGCLGMAPQASDRRSFEHGKSPPSLLPVLFLLWSVWGGLVVWFLCLNRTGHFAPAACQSGGEQPESRWKSK